MHFVIWRDDDTNALTPIECLERLYRPFLNFGLPINLATIPNLRSDATNAAGEPEGFLFRRKFPKPTKVPLGSGSALVQYLRETTGYHLVQHGYDHSFNEFECSDKAEVEARLEQGTQIFGRLGFAPPRTFVAPYDKFSSVALAATARRFDIISTGWFELRRLPKAWWPAYLWKKCRQQPHWKIGRTRLLSHPGCLLSWQRPRQTMLETIQRTVLSQPLTVLVTHWWEYFRGGIADESFIRVLHQTAEWLAERPDVRVIPFEGLLTQTDKGEVRLNQRGNSLVADESREEAVTTS